MPNHREQREHIKNFFAGFEKERLEYGCQPAFRGFYVHRALTGMTIYPWYSIKKNAGLRVLSSSNILNL